MGERLSDEERRRGEKRGEKMSLRSLCIFIRVFTRVFTRVAHQRAALKFFAKTATLETDIPQKYHAGDHSRCIPTPIFILTSTTVPCRSLSRSHYPRQKVR